MIFFLFPNKKGRGKNFFTKCSLSIIDELLLKGRSCVFLISSFFFLKKVNYGCIFIFFCVCVSIFLFRIKVAHLFTVLAFTLHKSLARNALKFAWISTICFSWQTRCWCENNVRNLRYGSLIFQLKVFFKVLVDCLMKKLKWLYTEVDHWLLLNKHNTRNSWCVGFCLQTVNLALFVFTVTFIMLRLFYVGYCQCVHPFDQEHCNMTSCCILIICNRGSDVNNINWNCFTAVDKVQFLSQVNVAR